MSTFQALRERRHAQWLTQLKQQIWDVVNNQAEPAPQIYLFGSKARGDWDGFSDTDLLVVAATKEAANHWADLLLDHGVAQDVIGLDQEAWVQLPDHPSVIWRHVARDAVALLELGIKPPHTPVLNDLVQRLGDEELDVANLEGLPLRALSRMAIQSRYPVDTTPPADLFDLVDAEQAIKISEAVLDLVAGFDASVE